MPRCVWRVARAPPADWLDFSEDEAGSGCGERWQMEYKDHYSEAESKARVHGAAQTAVVVGYADPLYETWHTEMVAAVQQEGLFANVTINHSELPCRARTSQATRHSPSCMPRPPTPHARV